MEIILTSTYTVGPRESGHVLSRKSNTEEKKRMESDALGESEVLIPRGNNLGVKAIFFVLLVNDNSFHLSSPKLQSL